MKIIKKIIPWSHGETNAFCFLPEGKSKSVAIFSHGYTSHKDAILTWAIKLSQAGVVSILFDLPGHYLGTFSEVKKFEDFSNDIHHIFRQSYDAFLKDIDFKTGPNIILGGHSLGALLALKAAPFFNSSLIICVAHGLSLPGEMVVWDSPFFKETMEIREQLVSPALKPSNIFPWIQKEQQVLSLENHKIVLIGGKDDLIVSEKRVVDLKNHLEKKNNLVTLEIANKLPHNQPEMAASLIKKIVKEFDLI